MRELKFELVGRNVMRGDIIRQVRTLQQLIDGNFNRQDILTFFDTNNGNCEFLGAREYTGLKDKNGKEIYEGDIITTTSVQWDHIFNGVVVYSELSPEFLIDEGDDGEVYNFDDTNGHEVIGNIYENPELLEVK